MNNQKYWEERAILKDKLLEKDINKLEKKLLKLFKDTRKEVLNELKIIYADIESSEYEKYQIDNLLISINNVLDNLYSNNEKEVNEGLKDIYKEMDKQASIDLNNSFNTVNENLVRETLKTNWSGLSFSERIWEHRRSLAFTIKSELNKGLIRGESLQDISKIISDKFDTSFSNAMRLVRTESCWIMNEATVNNYKNNGIKEYEFMAFLDSKTSKECRDLDGKKFSIEEYQAGVNLPPLHPNCRSCVIPVVEDIEKPNKEYINNEYYAGYKGFDVDNIPKELNREDYEHLDDGRKLYREARKERKAIIEKMENEAIERAFNTPRKYNTIEKANKKLQEIGIKETYLNNVDPMLYDDIIKSFEYNLNKVPMIKKYMHYIGDHTGIVKLYDNEEFKNQTIDIMAELFNGDREKALNEYLLNGKKNLLETVEEDYLSANNGMMMNSKLFRDYKQALKHHYRNLTDGFLFGGDGTIQSVFTHEIGHTVDKFLRLDHNIDISDFLKDNKDILEEQLSEYGKTNTDEAFAELYSNYIHRDKEKQNTLTKNFGIWLEDNLKKVGC